MIDPRTVSPLDTDDDPCLGPQDGPAADRRRSVRAVRLRRGDRGAGRRRRFRRSRRADPPAERRLRPHAVQPAAGEGRRPGRRRHRRADARSGGRVTYGHRNHHSAPGLVDGGRHLLGLAEARRRLVVAGDMLFALESDKARRRLSRSTRACSTFPPMHRSPATR